MIILIKEIEQWLVIIVLIIIYSQHIILKILIYIVYKYLLMNIMLNGLISILDMIDRNILYNYILHILILVFLLNQIIYNILFLIILHYMQEWMEQIINLLEQLSIGNSIQDQVHMLNHIIKISQKYYLIISIIKLNHNLPMK